MEMEVDTDEELIPAEARRLIGTKRPSEREPERPSKPSPQRQELPQGCMWTGLVDHSAWAACPNHKWEDPDHIVEIQLELPDNPKPTGRESFLKDPCQFFVKALKRRGVEVSEHRMSTQERQQFTEAKQGEVKKFLAAEALESLPPEARLDATQTLRMRWILTYKMDESGGKKAKARAVILGFQDLDYHNSPTFAPTMTRSS